jgi:hypothetical protein
MQPLHLHKEAQPSLELLKTHSVSYWGSQTIRLPRSGLVLCRLCRARDKAHARRRFFEAIKALPKSEQKAATAAHEGVRRIDALYDIEREVKGLSVAERAALRQQKAVPQLNALHAWASALQQQTLPSGKLGEALDYLTKQWPKLIRYVEDGRLAIDTNGVENAIRPFALGRRNWLFADTVKGAKASASLYSLVQSARANELEPYAYLRHLFAKLPAAKSVEDFEALLPFGSIS